MMREVSYQVLHDAICEPGCWVCIAESIAASEDVSKREALHLFEQEVEEDRLYDLMLEHSPYSSLLDDLWATDRSRLSEVVELIERSISDQHGVA